MTTLSESQFVVLSTACQRPDGFVFPVTLTLKGNAIGNVLKSLMTKGFLEEIPGRADDTVWRYNEGEPLTLRASRLAYDAIGIEPERDLATEERPAAAIDDGERIADAPAKQDIAAAKAERSVRGDSKQSQLIEMLERPEGAIVEEIVAAFGWQAHTVRGAIAGALKKKLGLVVTSEKVEGRGRVYKLPAA
ncbi:MAG: DUF3489 domain-containing protein [Beijerinckiaceae bacterium]|nr:DUF3489 domain-containing protein [Beijerinckiaceae bacterium]